MFQQHVADHLVREHNSPPSPLSLLTQKEGESGRILNDFVNFVILSLPGFTAIPSFRLRRREGCPAVTAGRGESCAPGGGEAEFTGCTPVVCNTFTF